jgi:hypothetical protein
MVVPVDGNRGSARAIERDAEAPCHLGRFGAPGDVVCGRGINRDRVADAGQMLVDRDGGGRIERGIVVIHKIFDMQARCAERRWVNKVDRYVQNRDGFAGASPPDRS